MTTTTTLSAAQMLRELARRLESAERAAIKTTAARAALPAIAALWPCRRVPIARDMLRTWIAVHRAQEAAS